MNRTASLCAVLLAAASLQAQGIRQPKPFPPDIGPATITVTGVSGKPVELTMADMGNFPQHAVKVAEHGVPVTFEGVLLKDVLARVDLPVGEPYHRTAGGYYLVVGAADGYRAVFAWAELDPTFMDKPVYLVTQRDGKPLSASDGPFELVTPGEKRNGRWVRQVTELTIRQAS
ncbi:MAG TPA: molybdopterin-dependent oxidoreductase [Bryobacteraceae bacterium]|nr:molybdopterin-dependent oxidoreductase [Bryobacteraceae bacterium]